MSQLLARKWVQLTVLCVTQLLAMTLWFSASAVVPQLDQEWDLSGAQKSWMTMSVQIGFVVGALLSALLNLADRVSAQRLIAISAVLGAIANGLIPLVDGGPTATLVLRLATGFALAGIYPPGMKLVVSWCQRDRGFGIGLLVGAIVLGSASPHLLNAWPVFGEGGMPPWRTVLAASSGFALLASVLAAFVVREGPFATPAPPFHWKEAGRALSHRPTRLANFGYFGHMWELYAMWTWTPMLLLASYDQAGWSVRGARVAGFATIAAGAIGCFLAGGLADRLGRTLVTTWSLTASGCCALVAGLFFDHPGILTGVVVFWGFAVVADSAQFSAAISELCDRRYVGTALTIQTCIGFFLTLITIRLIPPLVDWVGWRWAFSSLVVGPLFGIVSMQRLRRLPEATQMAGGNR